MHTFNTPRFLSGLCGTNQLSTGQPAHLAARGAIQRSGCAANYVSCVTPRTPIGATHPPELHRAADLVESIHLRRR